MVKSHLELTNTNRESFNELFNNIYCYKGNLYKNNGILRSNSGNIYNSLCSRKHSLFNKSTNHCIRKVDHCSSKVSLCSSKLNLYMNKVKPCRHKANPCSSRANNFITRVNKCNNFPNHMLHIIFILLMVINGLWQVNMNSTLDKIYLMVKVHLSGGKIKSLMVQIVHFGGKSLPTRLEPTYWALSKALYAF